MSGANRHRAARTARTALLCLCIVAYFGASLGVLPCASLLRKWGVLSTPAGADFPCAHHSCGCLSAESCWDSCCCFSFEERIAWAKEHHAFVPSWARHALADAGAAPAAHACCDHGSAPTDKAPTAPWGRFMSALSCGGVQPWMLTGVPPSTPDGAPLVVMAPLPAPAPPIAPALRAQNSLDPPSPPPKRALA